MLTSTPPSGLKLNDYWGRRSEFSMALLFFDNSYLHATFYVNSLLYTVNAFLLQLELPAASVKLTVTDCSQIISFEFSIFHSANCEWHGESQEKSFPFLNLSSRWKWACLGGLGVNSKVITLCKSVHKSNNGNERIEMM